MKLAQTIIENERNSQGEKNRQLVRIRLKELIYAYPGEILQVLHKTGVAVSTLLPSSVLHAVVIKNLPVNSELRDAIAKMLLELDGYSSADGTGWQLAGNVVSALGTVLSGVGRSQSEQTQSTTSAKEEQLQQQIELEKAKSKRTTWLIAGISLVVIVGIIIWVRLSKSKPQPKIIAT